MNTKAFDSKPSCRPWIQPLEQAYIWEMLFFLWFQKSVFFIFSIKLILVLETDLGPMLCILLDKDLKWKEVLAEFLKWLQTDGKFGEKRQN